MFKPQTDIAGTHGKFSHRRQRQLEVRAEQCKGQYGTFTVDGTGKWTYTLNNGDAKVQALTEGQKVTDTITVTVDDGNGGTATQVITVTITGTNDAAVITRASRATTPVRSRKTTSSPPAASWMSPTRTLAKPRSSP